MKIAGIEISHPDKVLFAKAGITKIEMVKYYAKIADKMLPYLKDRPLTLHRFPDGIDHAGFYQKQASDYFPDFIKTVKIKTEDGSNTQVICNSKKALVYLANQGTIGFHIWLAKKDKLDMPDKVIFDLDPPENAFNKVKKAAKITRDFLREKVKDPNLMTTGQSGFHVWYTMRRTKTFDELRKELREWAEELASQNPELLTTSVRKEGRNGKIFIDYLRNAYGQTAVCPYSLRPNESAGIAMPLSWDEIEKIKSADEFTLKNVFNK